MPLKVIGVGLGRTGTLSLKLALEQLGFGRCYHMGEVFANPEAHRLWVEAADGKPDWERIFEGYSSTTDYPACTFWRELTDYYPNAKIILSVRDPEKWFQSTETTIFSEETLAFLRGSEMKEFFEKTVWGGIEEHIHDRAFMVNYFKHHSATVESAFPGERLLVFEAAQGWEPLCAFLGVPVPKTPYPRVNSSEEALANMTRMRETGQDPPRDLETMRKMAKARMDDLNRKHSS